MSLAERVADWTAQQHPGLSYRKLASKFRAGHTLERHELYMLRRYAEENGNYLLAQRCRTELRLEREED